MLTWEWTINHATKVRTDWAGRFWYSFYERGAIMADFCQHALAYMTGQPFEDFKKLKTPELSQRLLHHLQKDPWLLILDGLERVLVAYHRIDAAQVSDEEANQPTDQIAHRDPCTAIRPEDDDLLRKLAAAAPSKLLISSRLVPRVLLNPANQGIPGVLRVALQGLRPSDAELLVRSVGITGDSEHIQSYLKKHCDCHPLVTGVLAGLINNYLPDRGNFDAWEADPDGGGQLNLADLDLIQRRNHILQAAIDGLPEKSRELLSILALLSEAVDYQTLSALNPHLPPEPKEVEVPAKPEDSWDWDSRSEDEKEQAQKEYQSALKRRADYEKAVASPIKPQKVRTAQLELMSTVTDLERRGLLQYDHPTRKYDLHPVVRGIAAGGLLPAEKDSYGQRVVDHFSAQAHRPYNEAETILDLGYGIHIVRTLLKMERHQEACDIFWGDLSYALLFNLEAYAEMLSLLKPFFRGGWATMPNALDEGRGSYLANCVALALRRIGERKELLVAYGASLASNVSSEAWRPLGVKLQNISAALSDQNRLAQAHRCASLSLNLAILGSEEGDIFRARMHRFFDLGQRGQWPEAKATWDLLAKSGQNWSRAAYRPGDLESNYAFFRFWQGDLNEEHLAVAERLATEGKNRAAIRYLHAVRGEWHLELHEWSAAAESLSEAVSMARATGRTDSAAETQLALAKFHLGQLRDPYSEAEQLANGRRPSRRALADLPSPSATPNKQKITRSQLTKRHGLTASRTFSATNSTNPAPCSKS